MRFDQLPLAHRFRLEVFVDGLPHDSSDLDGEHECRLFRDARTGDILLSTSGSVSRITGATDESDASLNECVDRDLPRIVWVVNTFGEPPRLRAFLEFAEYPIEYTTSDEVRIGVNEKISESAGEIHFGRAASVFETIEWLADELLVPDSIEVDRSRAIVSHSPGVPDGRRAAFRMFGASVAADVREDVNGKLLVERILRNIQIRAVVPDGRLVLLRAPVAFSDFSTVARFNEGAKASLERLVNSGRSYLDFWRQYNDAEERLANRRARSVGYVNYHSAEDLGGGTWRFHVSGDEDLEG